MKKFIFSLVILIIALLFYQCGEQLVSPGNNKPNPKITMQEEKIASSSSTFGLKLFKRINDYEGNKNIFISPLSISTALGMTLNGAYGATYDSMKAVLELKGLTEQEINESYKNLINLLISIDPKVVFNIANSIWHKDNMSFLQSFIEENKTYFNAEVTGLNFDDPASVDIINNWVNQNTNGKIPEIIKNIPSYMVMYLINAIYFKGDWKYQFDKDNTQDDMFTTGDGVMVPCKMMAQENDFNYFSNDIFQAIELPYGDSSFSMIILLPKSGNDINNVIEQLNEINWNAWLSSFNINKGRFLFPKFEINYEIKLNDVLTIMGMGIAFSYGADFSRILSSDDLFISEVLHKTYVKVDEEGTEAAAVTSVGVGIKSTHGSGFYMRVDKPFIFVIKDNYSNSILFIGKIINPGLE